VIVFLSVMYMSNPLPYLLRKVNATRVNALAKALGERKGWTPTQLLEGGAVSYERGAFTPYL